MIPVLLASVVLAQAAGCGGGHGSGGSAGGSSDAEVALTAAGQQWDAMPHTNAAAAADQMVTWLKTQPAFRDAGVSNDLTVWATLQDGSGAAFTDESLFDPPTGKSVGPIGLPPTRAADPGLPTGRTAYLFQMTVFNEDPSRTGSDIRPQLATFLQKAGYTVVRADGTLADFKATIASDNALLWTNTHGGFGMVATKGVEQKVYFIFSSTVIQSSDLGTGGPYASDIQAGRLLRLHNVKGGWYLGITAAWLQDNAHFGHNSLWINDACESATTTEMSDAAFHSGLSAYTGWDESVLWPVANNAAMYLVDRMAGVNLATPVPDPPQRPFDLESVVSDMGSQNPPLTVSSVTIPIYLKPFTDLHDVVAHLQVARNSFAPQPPDQFSLLAPTISTLTVAGSDLQISGQFGEAPGSGTTAKVTVGGTEVPADWSANLITAHLPGPGQPGFAGDVQVTVNGVKSNIAQLTLWPIKFHLLQQQQLFGTQSQPDPNTPGQTILTDYSGSHTSTAEVTVYIRCDVRDPRGQSGQTPPDLGLEPEQACKLVTGQGVSALASLTGWSFGGTDTTHTYSTPIDVAEHTLSNAWSNGASPQPPLPLDGSAPLPEHFDNGQVSFHHANRALMSWITARLNVPLHVDTTSTASDGTKTTTHQDTTAFLVFAVAQPSDQSQPYPLLLDTGYGIQAGQITIKDVTNANSSIKVTVSWDATPAQFPPDPNAARAKSRSH